ncbi:MAG TPA: PQQ-dependent sugar dehydrogenase [Agriterribacter sp.]|nr:PQQ-dependent sugar dehydrogenase [Agriterribacter sp.]
MKKILGFLSFLPCVIMITVSACAGSSDKEILFDTTQNGRATNGDNAGLTLPDGFTATVVAEKLGRVRHIVVNSNGDIYAKLSKLVDGKGILKLKGGMGSNISSFGNYPGTGIAIKNGFLYASSNSEVFRYTLNAQNEVIDADQPETIVKDLTDRGQHNSKSIALDDAGNIYVNIGAPSNSCQVQDRAVGSKGQDPCPILGYAGGIWQFKADKLNQTINDGVRYATGIRNTVGLDWNSTVNELYVMQHGRDDLHRMFDQYYTVKDNAELPAEEFLLAKKGSDFGWPYCYYDGKQQKKLLNPEYGGDGKIEGRCKNIEKPIMAFPAHLAPNALLFYTGNQFPEKYRNGAFIAFHGSWNRAPEPQAGYFVAFVPMKDGKPSGEWEIFADGFAGGEEKKASGRVDYRPCGLAQGPDGSLYISDDSKGNIWKINYSTK